MRLNRSALGAQGEQIAERFLRTKGYRILARNVRSKLGEIDLVATEGKALVFVEVRSASGSGFGRPEESLRGRKQGRLSRLARAYLTRHRLEPQAVRFDLVTVVRSGNTSSASVHLIRGAFETVDE